MNYIKRYVAKKYLIGLLLLGLFFLPTGTRADAAGSSNKTSQWVETGSGRMNYYNSKGKRLKNGMFKVGSKYYYFDKNGAQRNGWIKIKGNYYYFSWRKGAKGYRIQNRVVNGIRLNEDGRAVNVTVRLKYLALANEKVFELCNWKQSKSQALRACFAAARDIVYWGYGSFQTKNYLSVYGNRFFKLRRGDCHTQSIGFALLAAARGFQKVYFVRASNHGWVEINGKIYDANWARWNREKGENYVYGITKAVSEKNGRYNYYNQEKMYRIDQ